MEIRDSKNFLLKEIKINNPSYGGLSMEDFLDYKDKAEEEFDNYSENISDDEREEFDRYSNQVENSKNVKDIDDALLWLFSGDPNTLSDFKNGLSEDVRDFNIGQTSNNNGIKTTVTDVEPETQSVTWDVKKEITDEDIHKKMSSLINDFEKIKLKDFHSRPKLIQLIRDLKTIRNKFSRTIPK